MSICTVILAGGRGTRIGGDKALQLLQGKSLLAWVLDRMRPQCDELLLSANGDGYTQFACPVIQDHFSGYAGPLAGLQAGLRRADSECLLSVPCDAPFLPADLAERLRDAAGKHDVAVATTAGRRQPAVALYHRRVLPSLEAWLADGGRKVRLWQDRLDLVEVPFEHAADFINLNTTQELALANQILNEGGNHDDIERALA